MKDKSKINKNSFIRDCNLSLRTQNVLYNNSEVFGVQSTFPIINNNLKISDIGKISLSDMSGFKNCGKKTLSEIKELCKKIGVELQRERTD